MDLRIALRDPALLRERCAVTGVRTTRDEPTYENGAVVPAESWQPVTNAFATEVGAFEKTDDSRLVELVRVSHVPTEGSLDRLADPLGDPDAIFLGLADSPAAALTTTENHENGRRIGLHVDNWDKRPYATRHRARRRLCLNLGPGTRYILLADHDIQTICRTIRSDHESRHPHTDDLRLYIRRQRPLRCLRIRLAPGEGYIAPTELLPHDGSTENQPEPSTAAFWLGHWPRAILESLV